MEWKKWLGLALASLLILGYVVVPTPSPLSITIQVITLTLSGVYYHYFRKYLEATPAGSTTVNHYIFTSFTLFAQLNLGYSHLFILASYMFQSQIQKILDSSENLLLCSLLSPQYLVTPLCLHLLFMTCIKLYITIHPQRFLGINFEKLWRYLQVIGAVITVAEFLFRLGTNGNICNQKSAPFIGMFLGFKINEDTFVGKNGKQDTIPLLSILIILACAIYLIASLIGSWKKHTTPQHGNMVPNIQIGANFKLQLREALPVQNSKRLVHPETITTASLEHDFSNSLEVHVNVQEGAVVVNRTTKEVIYYNQTQASGSASSTHEQNTRGPPKTNHAKIVQVKSADPRNIISLTENHVESLKSLVEPQAWTSDGQNTNYSPKEHIENEESIAVQGTTIALIHSNKKQAHDPKTQNMTRLSEANLANNVQVDSADLPTKITAEVPLQNAERLVEPQVETKAPSAQDISNSFEDQIDIEEVVVVVEPARATIHSNNEQPLGYMSSVNEQNRSTGKEQANPANIVYAKPADSMKISSLPEDQTREVPSHDDAQPNRYPLTFLSTSQEATPALHEQKYTPLKIFKVLSLCGFMLGVSLLLASIIVYTVDPNANLKLSTTITKLNLLVLELMPVWMIHNIPGARDFMIRKLKRLARM